MEMNTDTVPLTRVLSDRAYWKHLNRCTNCHVIDAFTINGRSLCGACAGKSRKKKADEYALDKGKTLDRNRNAYQFRKENGLCVKCGKPIEDGNYRVRCLDCTKKLSYREKLKALQKPQRGDNGICYMCNRNPVMAEHKLCVECYEKCKANMLKAQAESTAVRKRKNREHRTRKKKETEKNEQVCEMHDDLQIRYMSPD